MFAKGIARFTRGESFCLLATLTCQVADFGFRSRLLALIQSGTFGDALGRKAIIDIGTPVVHWLIKALESLKLEPQRVSGLIHNPSSERGLLLRYHDHRL